MTLEASGANEEKKSIAVEPLLFRNLAEIAEAMPDELMEVAEEAPFDLETALLDAHERGRREALLSMEAEMQQRLEEERALLSRAVQQFEQEKQRYFSEVEGEVVRLSLAIAERVLHREATMDPMLLAGAARVALEQVSDSSEAVLRVNAQEAHRWNETLGDAAVSMQIEPDEHLGRGEVVLKTRSGSVQLGLKAQLLEIERGFFELLGRRPAMAV